PRHFFSWSADIVCQPQPSQSQGNKGGQPNPIDVPPGEPSSLIGCCPCPCLQQSIDAEAPRGIPVGRVVQDWSMCNSQFRILDASGETVLRIEGPCCTFSLCGPVEFQILSKTGITQPLCWGTYLNRFYVLRMLKQPRKRRNRDALSAIKKLRYYEVKRYQYPPEPKPVDKADQDSLSDNRDTEDEDHIEETGQTSYAYPPLPTPVPYQDAVTDAVNAIVKQPSGK
ncbi:unnamed protein product, partial [Allacma fusca]